MNLNGQIALVTGANRGLGRLLVDELLSHGVSKVYAGVRDLSSAPQDERIVPVRIDHEDPESIIAAAQLATDVTILVNNAGAELGTNALTSPLKELRREMEINAFGPLLVTRALAPVIGANGGGGILNVLSSLSFVTRPEHGGYAAAKAAAMSLTNVLRQQLAEDRIQVTAVHVGYMDTDMTAEIDAPKSDPAVIARKAVDGFAAGDLEVLADDGAVFLKGAISQPLTTLYPDVYVAG